MIFNPASIPDPEDIGAVRAFGKYAGGTVAILDTLTTSGYYSWLAPADNPFGAAEGALFTVAVDCPNYGGNPSIVQTITQTYAAGGTLPLGASFRRSFYQGVWSSWAKSYDTNNKPTPAEIGAAGFNGAASDCNKATVYGKYNVVDATLNCPNGRGYGGDILIVTPWDENTVHQMYVSANVHKSLYHRFSAIGSTSDWTDWKKIYDEGNLFTASTVDITAGSTALETGKLYLVYE